MAIASDHTNYRMQYCKDGYFPRTFTTNDNHADKIPVTRGRIRLIRASGTHPQATRLLHDDTKRAVLFLASTNVEAFIAATNALPAPEQHLIKTLAIIFPAQQRPPITEAEVRNGLDQLIAALQSDLHYFWMANPKEFAAAINAYPDFTQYLKERPFKTAGDDAANNPTLAYVSVSAPGPWTCEQPPPFKQERQSFAPTDTALELWGKINNPAPGQHVLLQWTEEAFIPALVTSAPTEASASSCLWARLPIAGTALATHTADYRLEVRLSSGTQPAATWIEPIAVIYFSIILPGTR
ncbi:MAG TPA: hypothetical protein VN380_05620 [Thermoanaerobaculia bacterium]|nr:hypothetical protein [Thermoanaerobaculia bacterium]